VYPRYRYVIDPEWQRIAHHFIHLFGSFKASETD
jgi:hypothetical protein